MAGENDERLAVDADLEASDQTVEEAAAELETPEEQAAPTDADKEASNQAEADTETDADADAEADAEADAKPENAEEQPSPAKAEEPAVDDVDPEDKPEGIGNIIAIAVIALIFGLLLCLPATMGSAPSKAGYDLSGGVAASFDGAEIGENDITNFIMNYRESQGLEDDAAWGEWMVSYGYTPEALRSDTVNYFIQKELIAKAAKEQGVEVTESDVEKRYAEYAEQVGGEDILKSYLEQDGVTVESYKESISLGMLQEALADKVVTDVQTADDETILQVLKIYYPDQVPSDATSLEEIDENLVNSIRQLIDASMKEEAYNNWLNEYKSKANIVVNDMPKGLPYDIDLEPYKDAAGDLAAMDGELVLDENGDTTIVLDEEGDAEIESDAEVESDAEDGKSSGN